MWKTCSVYGMVVDVFILSKTSKAVRFERPHKPNETPNANSRAPNRIPKPSIPQHSNSRVGSYANIVNGVSSSMQGLAISTLPALVLDDTCLVDRDLSNHAMGKMVNKVNMMNQTGVNSWFQVIQEACNDFVSDEWIFWVDIEGVPLNAWSSGTFTRIGKKWGETLDLEDNEDTSFGCKRLCVNTKHVVSILETFKVIIKGKFLSHKQDNEDKDVTHSEDPFGLYDLLKNKKGDDNQEPSPSLSHPLDSLQKLLRNEMMIQETKMTRVSDMDVKFLWGNSNYDYVYSDSLGSSGGILCIWEALVFKKDNVTVSDNFISIYRTWLPSNSKILYVAIYAPQQVSCKKNLWDYISIIVGRWNEETIIMEILTMYDLVMNVVGLVFIPTVLDILIDSSLTWVLSMLL
nr:RNA-directed DNA polymerase, eukaryota [Tanacetum cinerariifolium]